MRVGRALALGTVTALAATSVLAVVVAQRDHGGLHGRVLEAVPAGRVDSQNGDCGWTVPLGDEKVLWVVCDPTALPGGLTNSIAVSDPEDRSPPFQEANFVPPAPADVGRCSTRGGAASWIDGVTAAPGRAAGTTLVTAFFIHGCRASLLDRSDAGDFGVATYTYVHGSTGIRRTQVQRWDLFPGRWSSGERNVALGAGAVYHDGYQYAYGCHPDETPDWVNERQCAVARVPLGAAVGARESWAFWLGPGLGWAACTPDAAASPSCSEASFRAASEAAAPLDMPLPDGEDPAAFTPQQLSVSWSDALELFVAAAPRAFGDPTLRVRVARAPEGPWSPPGDAPLDCEPDAVPAGFNCYHVAPHPEIGTRDHLPFGVHDAGNPTSADLELVEVPLCELALLADRPCR